MHRVVFQAFIKVKCNCQNEFKTSIAGRFPGGGGGFKTFILTLFSPLLERWGIVLVTKKSTDGV